MRLLVIGGTAAGLSAAARARRLDRSLEIVVVEKGEIASWGACGLPYYLEGRVREVEHLATYSPEYFLRERNITVRTKTEAAAIHHGRRQAALAGGERISYDKLVIATGARPERSIAGADLPHVFTMHTPADGLRLKAALDSGRARRGAVIGGGYIGLEAAEVLRMYGLDVTVFEANFDLLGRQDPRLTEAVVKHASRFRIEVRCGTAVKAIEPGRIAGEPFDMVVMAAGVKPNVELAVDAGVELGRTGAIRVSDRMETNLNGVYAAGDCAEAMHIVSGRPVYLPLGTTANKMGRVAGANAAGRRERFAGIAGTTIVRVCGLGIGVTGFSEHHARKNGFDPVSARIEGYDKPPYFFGNPTTVELVADRRTRRVIGGSVLGEDGVGGRIDTIACAVTAGMRVEDFEQLDLAYAPPFAPVWDPLLIAARQVSKLLD